MSNGGRFTELRPDGSIVRRNRHDMTEAEERLLWAVQTFDTASRQSKRSPDPFWKAEVVRARLDLREACQALLADPVIDGPAASR